MLSELEAWAQNHNELFRGINCEEFMSPSTTLNGRADWDKKDPPD